MARGYATGQFGKNHLGDLNKYLPNATASTSSAATSITSTRCRTVLVFVPEQRGLSRQGRSCGNLVHAWATDVDDATEMPRWEQIGKQKIEDEGPLAPFPDMSNVANMHDITPKAKFDMTTFDEVLVKSSCDFMNQAKKDGKPFFVWHNTTRMHVWTFLMPKYKEMMNAESNYGLYEAGMAQMDDSIGDHEALGRNRRGRQYDPRLHDRQRGGSVHLAGRRDDAV